VPIQWGAAIAVIWLAAVLGLFIFRTHAAGRFMASAMLRRFQSSSSDSTLIMAAPEETACRTRFAVFAGPFTTILLPGNPTFARARIRTPK
jgi:hypothetical protein